MPFEPFAAASPDSSWPEIVLELKRIAKARLHASGTLSNLNTTALVNESYLRLSNSAAQPHFATPGHFYAYAAKVMRSVIVDTVRETLAARRGGPDVFVTLDSQLPQQTNELQANEVLQVDHALTMLAEVDARLAQVVDMRYFAGMTEAEIASVLGLTERTVRRDWEKARAILHTMLA